MIVKIVFLCDVSIRYDLCFKLQKVDKGEDRVKKYDVTITIFLQLQTLSINGELRNRP